MEYFSNVSLTSVIRCSWYNNFSQAT